MRHTPWIISAALLFAALMPGQVRGGSNYSDYLPPQAEFNNFNTFALCLSPDRNFATPNGPAINSIFNYDVDEDSIDAELQAMF